MQTRSQNWRAERVYPVFRCAEDLCRLSRTLRPPSSVVFLKLTGVYALQPEPTKEPKLVKLGEKIGIKFITTDTIDCVDFSYDAPTEAQLQKVIDPLVFELSLYPREALRRTRIEQIVLCNGLWEQ